MILIGMTNVHYIIMKRFIQQNMIKQYPLITNPSFYVCQHFLIEVIKCLQINDQFSIVFDFSNYKLYHTLSNVSVAYNLSNIISICSTDHLNKIYLIDPPSYISPLVVMIKKAFYNSIFTRIIQLSKKKYLESIKRVNH